MKEIKIQLAPKDVEKLEKILEYKNSRSNFTWTFDEMVFVILDCGIEERYNRIK